jgi:hypothetical protein
LIRTAVKKFSRQRLEAVAEKRRLVEGAAGARRTRLDAKAGIMERNTKARTIIANDF